MSGLKIYGQHDEKTVAQMWRCMAVGSVAGGVLCADGHYGYAQPVGGVVAYEKHVSISGVGFDIGCGNMAARLDMTHADLAHRVPAIARDISRRISFGIGRANEERVEHALFDDGDAWRAADVGHLKQMAVAQLGTVGSGNHYVDLFRDEEDHVWIGVHFGSRGLGHKAATKYLLAAGGRDGMDVPPAVVDEDSELGARYLAAMQLAGRYAYAGREWVVETIRRMLCAKVTDVVHNHHNYAWKERHGDRDLWVVRKGATPAFPGQRGFVGGSMGDDAVILEGVDGAEARASFYSTVHGAGRVCGRMEAKGKRDKATGEWKRPPRFTREQMDAWLKEKGVYLIGGDVDESPMAYRRLGDVLAAHAGTVKVLHTLRPFLVVMAGDEVRDPYKD
jgi:tRNA-splicing ligase RtcB